MVSCLTFPPRFSTLFFWPQRLLVNGCPPRYDSVATQLWLYHCARLSKRSHEENENTVWFSVLFPFRIVDYFNKLTYIVSVIHLNKYYIQIHSKKIYI